MSIVDKSQSGRACAEPASRPSAPRSGGGAKRRALTSVSTRARCWLDDAASDHNILRSTPSPVSVSSSRSATPAAAPPPAGRRRHEPAGNTRCSRPTPGDFPKPAQESVRRACGHGRPRTPIQSFRPGVAPPVRQDCCRPQSSMWRQASEGIRGPARRCSPARIPSSPPHHRPGWSRPLRSRCVPVESALPVACATGPDRPGLTWSACPSPGAGLVVVRNVRSARLAPPSAAGPPRARG